MDGFLLAAYTVGARCRRLLLGAAVLALLSLSLEGGMVEASRFGLPWQGQLTSDQVVRSEPDHGAGAVSSLGAGAIVMALEEVQGADGAPWMAIHEGYVPSSSVVESRSSWIAEVAVPTVQLYAKPYATSDVRRTAREGDLLRVTGVSPGLEGDQGVWWATTEGYASPGTLQRASGRWAQGWALPEPEEAADGWWAVVESEANVRAGATTSSPVVGSFLGGERVKVLAEEEGEYVLDSDEWYRIDGGRYAGARIHSSLVRRLPDPRPNTTAPPSDAPAGPWIVVDRSASTLTFVREGQPEFVTYVAIGRAGAASPIGDFRTFGKFRADDMTSVSLPAADHSYDLPNVPFTQYYREGGYAVHGTYWHDRFGEAESQGCINLTWADAAYLFSLTEPRLPQGVNEGWAALAESTPVLIVD